MAAQLPAKLKAADCQRFATRAAQLEKYRPIVTYWCEYYILQQILSKHLHTADAECQTYAITLMDKLEQTKTENPTNDAITDDVAAKAYIENFAFETFDRGDEAQRTGKVTRQTADTFQAAATFLDLLSIWGQPEAEVAAKSKFAKFHALRIARAIKGGEDPNASNPVVETPRQPSEGEEEGIEQELHDLERASGGGGGGGEGEGAGAAYRPPTVESASDSLQPSRPGSTIQEGDAAVPPPPSLTPQRTSSARGRGSGGMTPQDGDDRADVSPIEPSGGDADADADAAERQGSLGGGYFPSVPDAMGDADTEDTEDTDMTGTTEGEDIAHQQPPASMHTAAAVGHPPTLDPDAFYNHPTHPTTAPPPASTPPPSAYIHAQPPPPAPPQSSAAPHTRPPPVQPSRAFAPPPAPPVRAAAAAAAGPAAQAPPIGGYNSDDESVLAAQKHAKWAISALNFEDVGTAVQELRIALQALGAS
ncbi:hypothetical protein LTR36_003355 [Oleoguttula mirabilis]|uniref:DUF605-domain-containing protein n=1 Tax=Oleoguttula mirabilis TaxID=1507867 RepID=A0AAV9JXQ6_9PEZI|nr:hypothetical protein LTR36_003355 [Oleoguttula mirabilis]